MNQTLRRMRIAAHIPVALTVAIAVELGLRLLPLPVLARLVRVELDTAGTAWPVGVASSVLDPADAARYHAVRWVMRAWPFGRSGQCLRMALTAGCLLRHRGPLLCLGVVRRESGTAAHAWLVVDRLVFDSAAANCVLLVRPAQSIST